MQKNSIFHYIKCKITQYKMEKCKVPELELEALNLLRYVIHFIFYLAPSTFCSLPSKIA